MLVKARYRPTNVVVDRQSIECVINYLTVGSELRMFYCPVISLKFRPLPYSSIQDAA